MDSVSSLPGVIVAAAADDPMPFSGHFAAGDVEVVGRIARSNNQYRSSFRAGSRQVISKPWGFRFYAVAISCPKTTRIPFVWL